MRPIRILLVEDNPGDVLLTREAFLECKVLNELTDMPNGEEALKLLNRQEPYEDAKAPDLILLDINMPKMSGFDVLERIKQSAELKKTPVIMLTTSSSAEDISRAYETHANAYLTKPVNYADFLASVKLLGEFWLDLARLPNKG